jgi:2-alkenal reductase
VPELINAGRAPTPGIGIIGGSQALAAQAGVAGVVVVRTLPISPAERAGLEGVNAGTGALGDVITGVDNQGAQVF